MTTLLSCSYKKYKGIMNDSISLSLSLMNVELMHFYNQGLVDYLR